MRSDKQLKQMEAIHLHPLPPNVHKAHLMVTEAVLYQHKLEVNQSVNKSLFMMLTTVASLAPIAGFKG